MVVQFDSIVKRYIVLRYMQDQLQEVRIGSNNEKREGVSWHVCSDPKIKAINSVVQENYFG